MVATSGSLEVEDAVAFDDSVAAIRRHLDDGTSNENVFEVQYVCASVRIFFVSIDPATVLL